MSEMACFRQLSSNPPIVVSKVLKPMKHEPMKRIGLSQGKKVVASHQYRAHGYKRYCHRILSWGDAN
jgi:hypothetical protein